MRRPLFLLLVASALLVACEPPVDPTRKDCNVILVSIDTLRSDRLGCYGHPGPISPNVDALSRDSVLFETAISTAPSTTPSHASMFTSALPSRHGAGAGTRTPISAGLLTLPEILTAQGWRCASFNDGGQVSAQFGFDRGFELYESTLRSTPFASKAESALRWIDANPGEKFFLFLHSYEVHAPYEPSPEHLSRFETGYAGELPDSTSFTLILDVNERDRRLSPEDLDHVKATYDAQVPAMDEGVGALIAGLKERGLYDDTILIFTSDHGEELGERGRIARHTDSLFDETLRVPLIMKLADGVLADTRVVEQVSLLDLAPTLLELLQIAYVPEFDGRSVVDLMRGVGRWAEKPALSQVDSLHEVIPTSVRLSDRKLMLGPPLTSEPTATHEWHAEETEFSWSMPSLTLDLASAGPAATVEVFLDGEAHEELALTSQRQSFRLKRLGLPGRHELRLRADGPCVEVAGEDGCRRFRLFNSHAYYRLDSDPGETRDLIGDPARAGEVAALRQGLADALTRKDADESQQFEMSPVVLEQLRSLGYVD